MKYPLTVVQQSRSQHTHHIKKHKLSSVQQSLAVSSHSRPTPSNQTKSSSLEHYQFTVGEQMGEFKITRQLGEGTFGRVLQGQKKGRRYAIKVIRPVGKYIESAKIEKEIIKAINKRDERDEQGIVRYKQSFYHMQHFCMAFQPLGLSLYEIIKKNQYRGFPLKLVQTFLRQIFRSIAFLHKIGYTHTDLKPENILLEKEELDEVENGSEVPYFLPRGNKIRVIDFGGATLFNQPHSSVICTRQYRPPEVILQCCEWNQLADVWSIGCIAVELLTGDLLFPTHGDSQHLVMICKNSGRVPQWMINKAGGAGHRRLFRDGLICEEQADRQLDHWQNVHQMRTSDEVLQECQSLRQLVRECLQIDPNRRINCASALRHRFFQERYG